LLREMRRWKRGRKTEKRKGKKKLKINNYPFSVSLSNELRRLSNNGAISRHFSSHVLHLIRVEFKRECKPDIPRHFQIRLVFPNNRFLTFSPWSFG
jgi:hypothetical protein